MKKNVLLSLCVLSLTATSFITTSDMSEANYYPLTIIWDIYQGGTVDIVRNGSLVVHQAVGRDSTVKMILEDVAIVYTIIHNPEPEWQLFWSELRVDEKGTKVNVKAFFEKI